MNNHIKAAAITATIVAGFIAFMWTLVTSPGVLLGITVITCIYVAVYERLEKVRTDNHDYPPR